MNIWSSIQNTQRDYLTTSPHNQSQLQNSKALMNMTSINLSTINLRADKHLRTIEGYKEQQPLIVEPPYWYGSNPYAFPMGTLMMSMSMNVMILY